MSTANVVNPGLVNVADQGDGPVVVDQSVAATRPSTNSGPTARGLTFADGRTVVDQEVTVTRPSTNSGPTARGLAYADGEVKVDQPVTVSPPMTAGQTVEGGAFSPEGPNVSEVTANNVAGQVYGTGTPANVFV